MPLPQPSPFRARPAAAIALAASCAAAQPVDLSVTTLSGAQMHGFVGGKVAYSAGLSLCNAGPGDAAYVANSSRHPVWGLGMYRLADGRLDQIGISWLRHPAVALAQQCGVCNGVNGSALGSGCLDTTSASANASQPSLGPRFEVNPATGAFPFPFTDPQGPTGDAIFKRCQATLADVSDTSAIYFFEAHVVHPDETPDARHNNATYRRTLITPATAQATLTGPAVPGRAAIYAWRDHGGGVNVPDPNVMITEVSIPGDGLVIVASRVIALPDRWRYIYAIENISSHRAVGGLRVPLPQADVPMQPGFHDVDYHSGDPTDGTDWLLARGSDAAAWHTAHSHAQLPTANAIRFGTMYTFWFESRRREVPGEVTLDLFIPGAPARVTAAAWVPLPCGDPDRNQDGNVDQDDVRYQVDVTAGGPNPAGIDPDFNQDGNVDQDDIAAVINVVAGGPCP